MTRIENSTAASAKKKQPELPASAQPIKVALVEDQPRTRENWSQLINSFPDFQCVCCCGSAEEALTNIPQSLPDVVLMDIFLPRMSGIECTARLKARMPDIQIVMLTAMDNQELLFMALEAGADGYLLKRTKPSELRRALLDVLGGGVPMTSQIARRLIASFRKTAKTRDESTRLSAREEQILQLVSKGHSNKLIADKLEMNYETVCTHLKRVFKKLHVNSRTEAAILYINSKMSEQRPDADED
ncbi:MAG TPA: response regulator transcription factor [Verrucomicrobiae bacterium]|nr:response regulator transcription factor [Verrucomicrobiae bacterium]